jgi:CTP:molybdopterin cytidylyltransferase MocA
MCGRDPQRRRLMQELDPDDRFGVKALLPFLGRRIIDWQLDALSASPYVGDIYLVGLGENDAVFELPVQFVPVARTADFPDKLIAGLAFLEACGELPAQIVVSTSDAPAVTTESINTFLSQLARYPDHDFVLGVVPEALAEAAFPNSGRAVGRFCDEQVFPGELYALSPRAIRQGYELIGEINRRRRQIDRRAAVIKLWPIIRLLARRVPTWLFLAKYLLGRARLADAERAFSVAFDCRTKAIVVPDVGFGMDMDLPEDYGRLEAYMAERLASRAGV